VRAWTSTGQGLPGPGLPGGAPAADFASGRGADAAASEAAPPAGGRLRREFAGAVGSEARGGRLRPAQRPDGGQGLQSGGGQDQKAEVALFRDAAPGRAGLPGALAPVQPRMRPRLGGGGPDVRTVGGQFGEMLQLGQDLPQNLCLAMNVGCSLEKLLFLASIICTHLPLFDIGTYFIYSSCPPFTSVLELDGC
jgi:hypothetical protein